MKRSDFIEQVLYHDSNCIFVNKDQIELALDLFEDAGMMPPFYDTGYDEIQDRDFVTLSVDQVRYVGLCEWED